MKQNNEVARKQWDASLMICKAVVHLHFHLLFSTTPRAQRAQGVNMDHVMGKEYVKVQRQNY